MKAFVLSILSSLVFLFFIGIVFHSETRETRKYVYPTTIIKDCPQVNPPAPVQSDPNEKYRYVDLSFPTNDFKNRNYGQYKLTSGKMLSLKVTNGEFEYDLGTTDEQGWFFLKDVLFTDVTGDGNADAVVYFSHVECGGSCDGGRALFFIYTIRGDEWKEIWQYETGSLGYGCGLKSLTVLNKQLVLQMFGRCSQPKETEKQKFMVTDTTLANFSFNGTRFVKTDSVVIPAPAREVKNFDAKIHIID